VAARKLSSISWIRILIGHECVHLFCAGRDIFVTDWFPFQAVHVSSINMENRRPLAAVVCHSMQADEETWLFLNFSLRGPYAPMRFARMDYHCAFREYEDGELTHDCLKTDVQPVGIVSTAWGHNRQRTTFNLGTSQFASTTQRKPEYTHNLFLWRHDPTRAQASSRRIF
jgi:hypothetical protein